VLDNDFVGIYLNSSSSNTIYNNYFNNTNNAWDNGTNVWNTTKQAGPNIIGGPYLGGNYWSDYTGNDTNKDGLGDTPYAISGGSSDYLPLLVWTGPALEGHVDLLGFLATNVTVRFFAPGTQNETMKKYTTTDGNGNFTIGGIIPGTYDVGVKGQTSLSNLVTNVTLAVGNTTVVNFGSLLEGDVNNDDVINILDLSAFGGAFGSIEGGQGWNPNCDFNRDGVVNILDLSALGFNFGLYGDLLIY